MLLSGIQVISLVGRQGAGKSTIGAALARKLWCPHVEASQVVRNLCGDLPRKDLPFTNERTKTEPTWLGDAVAEEIHARHEEYIKEEVAHHMNFDKVVLTGVRETEVHDTLIEKHGATVFGFIVLAPQAIRYERLHDLGKAPTYEDFIAQEQAEESIGLGKLLSRIIENPVIHTDLSTDPDEIVANLVHLVENGKK